MLYLSFSAHPSNSFSPPLFCPPPPLSLLSLRCCSRPPFWPNQGKQRAPLCGTLAALRSDARRTPCPIERSGAAKVLRLRARKPPSPSNREAPPPALCRTPLYE
eukprot:6194677-Pleurochrysis_carterae.AAC.1